MKDRLKAIWEKIKNFWLKFNKKQRILFVTIFVVIIVVIIVLSKVIGKKDMVKLRACSNETEVVVIRNLLMTIIFLQQLMSIIIYLLTILIMLKRSLY